MSHQDRADLVKQHIAALREHFTDVQVLVSVELKDGNTFRAFLGAGNHFARIGMATAYLATSEHEEQAESLAAVINKPDDDGEEWKA
jgi:hypothetical protein